MEIYYFDGKQSKNDIKTLRWGKLAKFEYQQLSWYQEFGDDQVKIRKHIIRIFHYALISKTRFPKIPRIFSVLYRTGIIFLTIPHHVQNHFISLPKCFPTGWPLPDCVILNLHNNYGYFMPELHGVDGYWWRPYHIPKSDVILEDTILESFSDGAECGYVQYIILIAFILLGSWVIGWFHAPYRKSYIHINSWIISLFVTLIMNYTAIQVHLCPHKLRIACFYQLIKFIADCRQLMEHLENMRVCQSMLLVIKISRKRLPDKY